MTQPIDPPTLPPALDYASPPPGPSSCHRFLVPITILIWIGLYLGLCAQPLYLHKKGTVYPDFSSAGHNWRNGDSLYNRGQQKEFRYSPLVAAFFVPFDLLPDRYGEFIWRTINFALFVGGLYYCCRSKVPIEFSKSQICAVFLLCIPLAIGSLNNAQSNPLVLGLMLFSAGALLRKNWSLCCIGITIATCFKLYPMALGLLLLLIQTRKLSWRFFVCLVAAAVLPFIMQHAAYVMDQYTIWVHYLSTEDRQKGPITDWYRDFRALWRIYVFPIKQQTYLIIEVSVAIAIAISVLAGRFRKMPRMLLVGFAFSLGVCWMTVFGPATESATYILLAPTLAWGIVISEGNKTSKPLRIAYITTMGLFIAAQLALNIPGGKFFRDHLQPLPFAGLLLMLTVWCEMIGAIFSPTPLDLSTV